MVMVAMAVLLSVIRGYYCDRGWDMSRAIVIIGIGFDRLSEEVFASKG